MSEGDVSEGDDTLVQPAVAPTARPGVPTPPPGPETPAPVTPSTVNVSRLVAEAATTSSVLWVEVPGHGTTAASAHAVWFVWHDDDDPRSAGPAAYVVSGPDEQYLPWLPDTVHLTFRSKDAGGRLLTLPAAVTEVPVDSPEWAAAAEVLRPTRLNAPPDLLQRWRETGTIHVLRPQGRPLEEPGTYAAHSRAEPVTPAPGTTVRRRPWHWRGRAGARRNR